VWALAIMGVATLVNAWLVQPYLPLRNVVMVYLLGVIITAVRFGRGPSALATVVSVIAFDLVFVKTIGALGGSAPPDIIMFCVMLAVGFTISTLTGHVRFQVQASRQREQRMSALFAMSREFAELKSQTEIAAAAERHIGNAIGANAFVWLPDHGDRRSSETGVADLPADEGAVLKWVMRHNQRAGAGTSNFAEAKTVWLPLSAAQGCVGVVRVWSIDEENYLSSERSDLLQTLTSLTALAIERARLDTEAERLRNALLSAVSHDLRTPLAAIMGSSSTLVDLGEHLAPATRLELAESILDEGERLNRQVANLLEMTSLEGGSVSAHKEWQPLEEVAGVVLDRLKRLLKTHSVHTHLPGDLSPVPMDDGLVQQVLVNLLENATKYAPAGTDIDLSAWSEGGALVIEVADRGPGMPAELLERAFDRFFRGPASGNSPGVGLGLAICK
jgi:two-component system sensor histidine kinase KdpD